MPRMSMVQALNSAMDVMLARDDNVVVFGEDVGYFGGVFRCTDGLQRKYGPERVFDTPIAEAGILATAVGMGVYGLRPVVEIQFADYIYPATDQLVSTAARLRYRSAGEFTAPITVRAPCGGGIFGGQTHSQSPEAIFTHVCGLKTVMPSNPHDAKGLLISAIEDDDPVIFLEPKRLYNGPFDGHPERPITPWTDHPAGEVPDGHYAVPLGKASVVRPGEAVTVLTYGTMVHVALAAAAESGIDADIIDLRTLVPVDIDAITASVAKTGRCVIVHEATRTSGFGAELSALVQEACFYSLEAPIVRVTGWDTPYPHSLEWDYFPGPTRVADGLRKAMNGSDMPRYVFKLPDVGEGIAEVEVVEWHVAVGATVAEDDPLVDVMTDKATVELPSPRAGRVVAINGGPGDKVRVGAELVVLDVEGGGEGQERDVPSPLPPPARGGGTDGGGGSEHPSPLPWSASQPKPATGGGTDRDALILPRGEGERAAIPPPLAGGSSREADRWGRGDAAKPLASPAVRHRAHELGVALQFVPGTGPGGRINHVDLDAFIANGGQTPVHATPARRQEIEEVRIIGLRRRIAERMQESKRRIPHYSYVEELDVTALEELRSELNARHGADRPRLTLLPFLIRALVRAVPRFPQVNALFDDDAGIVRRHAALHVGIATQTAHGLMVPVLHHAEALGLWELATEIARLSAAARDGAASRAELGGSTITITSLGPIGGIASTPVINYPEVAIIGVNRIVERPVVRGGQIVVRKMMNLSSSFDHRVVDGWDAAQFIQELKALLEQPATLFIE